MPGERSLPESLKKAGLRVTGPRLALLAPLQDQGQLDVQAIADAARRRLGTLSIQAVYDPAYRRSRAASSMIREPSKTPSPAPGSS
jgi:hypothetical protein